MSAIKDPHTSQTWRRKSTDIIEKLEGARTAYYFELIKLIRHKAPRSEEELTDLLQNKIDRLDKAMRGAGD